MLLAGSVRGHRFEPLVDGSGAPASNGWPGARGAGRAIGRRRAGNVGRRGGDVGARGVVSAGVCGGRFGGTPCIGHGREAGCRRRRRIELEHGMGSAAQEARGRSGGAWECCARGRLKCGLDRAARRGAAVAPGGAAWRTAGLCRFDRTSGRGAGGDKLASWAHVESCGPGHGPGSVVAGDGVAGAFDGGMWQ